MHDTDLPGELADPLSRELTGYNGNSSYCFLNTHSVLGITLRAYKTAQALSLLFLAGHAVNQASKGQPNLTALYSLWPLLATELPQTLNWGSELCAWHVRVLLPQTTEMPQLFLLPRSLAAAQDGVFRWSIFS